MTARTTNRKPKVFWTKEESQKMASTILDIQETDRSLSIIQASKAAQIRTLPEDRRKSDSSMNMRSLELILGPAIESELRRRERLKKEHKDQQLQEVATAESRKTQDLMRGLVARSTPELTPVHEIPKGQEMPTEVKIDVDMSIEQILDALTTNIANKVGFDFKGMLRPKIRHQIQTAYQEVLLDELTRGVAPMYEIRNPASVAPPPAPAPAPAPHDNENGKALNGSEVPVFNRVKVLLIGNAPADDDYFLRYRDPELEGKYEFVRIKKPGELYDHKDARVLVSSDKGDNATTMAARALLPEAAVMLGKASATVKNWLETQFQLFQIGMVKETMGAGSTLQ